MDNITKMLPDGIYLFDKTIKLGDKLSTISFNIFIVVLLLICIGFILSFIPFRYGDSIFTFIIAVLIGVIIMMISFTGISIFAYRHPEYTYNEYKVSISESADIDKLNDNFIVIDKNDFVWTIVNKEDVENHVVTVKEYKD